jgi:response regulator RpfG family c-di-GMP phosphodiesterase
MEKANKKINVLYVDDEINNLTTFKANFRNEFNVFTVESPDEGLEILKNNEIHAIITDQYLKGISGVDFLQSIIKQYPDPMRVLLTGYAVIEDIIEAVNKTHIYAYINKPWERENIISVVNNAYAVYCKRKEQKNMLVNLQRTNEQLEFMLREKLVS